MLSGSSSSELPKPSLEIKRDDKFYNRLLSKETSSAHPSLRVYYGVASGAVPFLWESQPGTPKHTASNTNLPPLTPPPSSYCGGKSKSSKKSPKSYLIDIILPKLRKSQKSSSSSSSSSSSVGSGHHRRPSSSRSSFSSGGDEEDSDNESPTSTLCFGVQHRAAGGIRGCFSAVLMKNSLLPVAGHGSGQGAAA